MIRSVPPLGCCPQGQSDRWSQLQLVTTVRFATSTAPAFEPRGVKRAQPRLGSASGWPWRASDCRVYRRRSPGRRAPQRAGMSGHEAKRDQVRGAAGADRLPGGDDDSVPACAVRRGRPLAAAPRREVRRCLGSARTLLGPLPTRAPVGGLRARLHTERALAGADGILRTVSPCGRCWSERPARPHQHRGRARPRHA